MASPTEVRVPFRRSARARWAPLVADHPARAATGGGPLGPREHVSARPLKRPSTAFVPLVAAALLVAAACAPTPPSRSEIPNPSRSQVVPEGLGADISPSRRDLRYVAGGDPGCGPDARSHEACGGSQTLDIYRHEPSSASRGTLVYVHGGGFTGGDKTDPYGLDGPVKYQLRRGWDIVAIDYRLNVDGSAPWPTALDDVEAAIRWVRTEGQRSGLDTARTVVVGHSAGGTLAALAGVAWNTGDAAYASVARVDAWVDLSGIADFSLPDSGYWGSKWSPLLASQIARMSPVSYVDPGDPPGYIAHGDADGMVSIRNSHELKAAADLRGARVELDVVDAWNDLTWMPDRYRNHVATGGLNISALDAFLDRV